MEKISPAMEDYMKCIYRMTGGDPDRIVHVSDLATRMHVSSACASRATDTLSSKGFLLKSKYQGMALTQKGLKMALALVKRHVAIQRFLSEVLQVDPATAEEDACGIEHSISTESYMSIVQYLEKAK